jgi:hypothetical protein
MAGPSTTFTEMVSTTLRNSATEVSDNVSKNNALLNRLKKKNKIRNLDGGTEIQVQLEYAENGTYQRYAGLDTLNTNGSDVVTSAKYDWCQVALHVVSSGKELRQNSGKFAMINLVKTKKANALKTAANNFSVDLYSDGSLSNQIGGLANIIQTNGQGTVGGIDSGTWTFWRNKFKEATGTNTAATPNAANAAAFKADMGSLWLPLNRGADKPDMIVFSQDFYVLYETGEQQLQRYMDADLAQSGFISLKYKTADVIFDDNTNFTTTAEKGYFLNTDYIYVDQHKEAQWTQDDEKKPINQDAVIIPFYWMGNLVCSNRSLQGVIIDAS